jgi:hypothetical protein
LLGWLYDSNARATGAYILILITDQALWQNKVRESMAEGGGIKAAFEWRDAPYRGYRAGRG